MYDITNKISVKAYNNKHIIMKITIESYGKKYSVETENDDLTIDEYTDNILNILISSGFDKKIIIDAFNQLE